jgi:hypothetical protein
MVCTPRARLVQGPLTLPPPAGAVPSIAGSVIASEAKQSPRRTSEPRLALLAGGGDCADEASAARLAVPDVANPFISHRFGQLQQDPSQAKRKASWVLLGAEVVAVAYSWFFSWRQLLRVLPAVEPADYIWVAPISAGFIPLLLTFMGYAESLAQAKATDVPQGPYLCQACGRPFKTQAGLQSHTRQKHSAIKVKRR